MVRPNLQGKAVTREATILPELRRGNMKERWAVQEENPIVEKSRVVLLLLLRNSWETTTGFGNADKWRLLMNTIELPPF